jgi:hypothetical protein
MKTKKVDDAIQNLALATERRRLIKQIPKAENAITKLTDEKKIREERASIERMRARVKEIDSLAQQLVDNLNENARRDVPTP